MAFTKTFGTTSGAYGTATNWKPIDVTNPNYSWTQSTSGTNEYYLRTAGNGNPGFAAQPAKVYLNGSDATEGTMGSLTAGQWDYGDNDTLGFNTLYVRTSGSVDPDTLDPFYVKFYQIPQTAEHVHFASDSGSITSAVGLDQSGVAIGDFIIDEGYGGTIGSATLGYLYIDPDRCEIHGTGEYWLDIRGAAIPVQVFGTGNPDEGARGLYLRGSGITTLNVLGGHVGVAVLAGETATITTVRVLGSASCWLGSGVSLTTAHHYSGDTILRCAATTVVSYGGTFTTEEAGTITTATNWNGTFVANSTGTITTFHLYGGTLDEQQSGASRTISTTNLYPGTAQWKLNNEAVTHTTITRNGSLVLNIST